MPAIRFQNRIDAADGPAGAALIDPSEHRMRRVRAAQVNRVIQLVPLTMTMVVGNTALVLLILWDFGPNVLLTCWALAIAFAATIALYHGPVAAHPLKQHSRVQRSG